MKSKKGNQWHRQVAPEGTLDITFGKMAGANVNANSDGSTQMVPRGDTREMFEKHMHNTTYPTGFGADNMKAPIKLREQMEENSMLKGIPQIKSEEVDRDLHKMGEVRYEPAYELIVKKDIDKMQ